MEDASCVDDTLALYRTLRGAGLDNVGIVLQAYLKRTLTDIAELRDLRPSVRLCKGIYIEPSAISFKDPDVIRRSFVSCLDTLLDEGSRVAIATHDEQLIGESLVRIASLPPDGYEFQMLLGVRESRADELVAAGHPLRVYVPFGQRWYEYSLRRLQENPQMAGVIAKATLARASAAADAAVSGSLSSGSGSRAAVPTVAAIVAAVLGVVNLLSALTPNAHWRGHLLLAGRADRSHARLPRAGGARLCRSARRRVLPAPAPARCVAGGACPALRSDGPRHRQGPRCRGGGAHGCGSGAALVGTGRVLREGRPGAAALGPLARACDRRRDDPRRPRRRRVRRAARRLLGWFNETFELLTWQPGELRLGDEGGHLPLALGLLGLVALGSAAWLVFRPLAAPGRCPIRRCVTRSRSSCAGTATTRSRSSSSAAISTTSSPTTARRSSGTASKAG